MSFSKVIPTCFALALLSGSVLTVFCAGASAAEENGVLSPSLLRCEYQVDPLGIDAAAPRFSWIVLSPEHGQKQTAYQVLVSSNEERLGADEGDLWDSGKVESDETACIVYSGQKLKSHQYCSWKVRVWDGQGRASAWSKPARFSVGLLDPQDLKAQWVGSDEARAVGQKEARLDGAEWIGFAKEPKEPAATERLYFGTATIPSDVRIKKAEILMEADDLAWLVFNGQTLVVEKGGWQQISPIDVTVHAKPGVNEFRVQVRNSLPGPTGLLVKLIVETADGKTLAYSTDKTWRVTDNPGANWHNRELKASEWPACRVIGPYGCEPWGKAKESNLVLPPVKYLRGEFQVAKPVKRATAYVTALGICDLYLNGNRVSEDFFTPGWTDYTKRVYYRAYDVTKQVVSGANAVGGVLADGWYSGYVGFGKLRNHYGTKPRLMVQLNLEYDDNTTDVVTSGPSWKATTGPILEADFLMGETYDARLSLGDWSKAGFDASKWWNVVTGAEMQPVVSAHPAPPVRSFADIKARTIRETSPGVYVLNMGQNFAGVPRLTVKGKPGQKIQLRFAERLNEDGTVYTTNLREARVIDTYTCKGEGTETWQPRFTFHGFQYVEITGLSEAPDADTVIGVAVSSDTPVVGQFECSNPMLNQLHSNILWTQRMNFIDIPTDCPQRDERLGWTGDAQVYIRTATLNTDVQAFFAKWLVDLTDSQRKDGQFPMVSPTKVAGDDGGPAWADAGVICPWTVYEVYGDKRLLERQYDSMVRFIEFCTARSTKDLLPPAQYHCFGDWLSIKAETPKDVIYTAYFAYCTKLLSRSAAALGKQADADKYEALYQRIRESFNRAYVEADGKIKGDTQCVYVLALSADLLDEAKAKAAANRLVENIRNRGWHLSTGFIGTKDLMLVLAKIGRNDVAYRLLMNETFPSWGFSIKHGATSIWERWDGWTPDKGFQDPGMNSFAHYSFGAVYQWIVENIGGIRSDGVGFKRISLSPQFGGKLNHASVGYDSIRGPIRSAWKRNGDRMDWDVTIPANTTAVVRVPTTDPGTITESGKPLDQCPWAKKLKSENNVTTIELQSGSYEFNFTPDLIKLIVPAMEITTPALGSDPK